MKIRHIFTLLALAAMTAASAASVNDARSLIRGGEPEEALRLLDSIVNAQPRNADALQARGECLVALNRDTEAREAFAEANKRGSNDALLGLADIAVREYRTDDAEGFLDTYRDYIRRNARRKLTDESGYISERLSRTRSMLDRVEKIVVVDSIVIDAEYFFNAYRLSPQCGTLNSPETLPEGMAYAKPTVVYRSEDGRAMLWAAEDSVGNFVLRASDRLTGDIWDTPSEVDDALGAGADANYPFLMADGITLYYASDCDDSLGGYDIFMSRRDSDGFLQPQNIGMPYNSPYDDYMLAIDEITGTGWWATDRNRIPGKVTVYLFIPSEVRVNIPFDAPDLTDRARITSIAVTQEPDSDYSQLLARVKAIRPAVENSDKISFIFPLSDGTVLTSLSDFRSDHARDAMKRYLSIKQNIADNSTNLDRLRRQYAAGDTSLSAEILERERSALSLHERLLNTANDIIKAELRER